MTQQTRPVTRPVQVRAATPADVPAIAAIFAPYVCNSVLTFETVPPTERQWLAKLAAVANAGHPFLVVTVDGAVVGYAYVTPWKMKPAYAQTVENSIYLSPEHAGRGHGGSLLAALLSETAAAGARQVIAVIADSGDPASMALHRAAGFTEVGRLRQVGFKHGRWLDTALMQCTLKPTTSALETSGG